VRVVFHPRPKFADGEPNKARAYDTDDHPNHVQAFAFFHGVTSGAVLQFPIFIPLRVLI
jgi:hypothetical protein